MINKIIAPLRAFLFSLVVFPILTVVLSLIGLVWYFLTGQRGLVAWTLMSWSKITLWCLGAKVRVLGQDQIPKGGCLYLFNHSSFVDIFALASCIPNIKFGAKIELFSIPIFSQAMKAGGALPIPRQDRSKAIEILKDAEERARAGEQFALAPEGGRSAGGELMPFKSGPFIFAIESHIPVVPVVIRRASDVWPKGALFPGASRLNYEIDVEILKPVATEGLSLADKQYLSDQVRKSMIDQLAFDVKF